MSVRSQHIVNVVVKAFERKARTEFISFGSVVEDNVEDHFDTIVVEILDQCLKFKSFAVIFHGGTVACIWRKETDRIISPEVNEFVFIDQSDVTHLVKFEDWHQLYCIDSKLFQIRNLFAQTFEGTAVFNTGTFIHGKSADVKFIDDQVFHRNGMVTLAAPVKVGMYYAGAVTVLGVVHMSPLALSGDGACVRIQENLIFIEAEPFLLIIRSV